MRKRYAVGSYALGAATARIGDEMSGPALLLAGLAATGSASSGAALLAGMTVSAAAGGPLFGVLLDRSAHPGRLLAGALVGYAVALAAVLSSLGRAPFVCSVGIAVLAGLLGPALAGGWTSQLPRVAAPEALPRATAFDAMTFNIAALAGPALAGTVAGSAGAPTGVAVAVVLICLAVPSAWTLPAVRRPARAAAPAASVLAGLAAGFRAVVRTRALARATAASVVSCVGEGMLVACAPVLGARVLGGAGHGALLLSVVAASALAANAALSRFPRLLRPDTVLWCSPLVLAAAFLLAATGRTVPLIAAMVLAGIGEGPQLTALFAVRHREAPEELRGQIFTTGASLKITGFAVGAGLAGQLASWSLTGALTTAAGTEALAALVFAAVGLARPAAAVSSGASSGVPSGR
ncbi:MFS transporter [Streptomyces sp. NPDC050617]|uniref:MFS transporter n=1 Tax=Streptomyces sp. NPDC050617 TaxID=3154628 RepID=UPI003440E880